VSWQPYWGREDDILELGIRFRAASDDASALEHRFAKANGVGYGCPPLHWQWEKHKYGRAS
jgi:hypothetical protein